MFSELQKLPKININLQFYEDPLGLLVNNIVGKITEFLNMVGRGHRSRTLLNLLALFLSFAHWMCEKKLKETSRCVCKRCQPGF